MSLRDKLKKAVDSIADVFETQKVAPNMNQIMTFVCMAADVLSKDVCPLIVHAPAPESKFAKGWIKQNKDPRDFKLSHPLLDPAAVLKEIDLCDTGHMPPVYDQGQLGSCTWNALAAAIQYLCLKTNYPFKFTPSRLYGYYNTRVIEGSVFFDNGAMLRDCMKAFNDQGVCPEAEGDGTTPNWLWPYSDGMIKFRLQPPHQCYQDAKLHGALRYEAVPQTEEGIDTCLANGLPVVFGIEVFESFESDVAVKTGVIPMPDQNKEQLLGGHALLIVGKKPFEKVPGGTDPRGYYKFRNSWSEAYGDKGYGYLPVSYVLDSNLSSDFWCLELLGHVGQR